MSNFFINRIGDSRYRVDFNDNQCNSLIISYHDSSTSSKKEDLVCIAKKIAEDTLNNTYSEYYVDNERLWEVLHRGPEQDSCPFLSQLTGAIHPRGNDGIEYLEIIRQDRILDTDVPMASSKIKNKIPLRKTENLISSGIFSSPFSVLAAEAFEIYENEYDGKDYRSVSDCNYCIQMIDENVVLVENDPTLDKFQDINKSTILYYRNYVIQHCGIEKFNYICHRFDIDFNKLIETGKPLTPEIIYRINIGLNKIETTDLNDFLQKLPEFQEKVLLNLQHNPMQSSSDLLLSIHEPLNLLQRQGIFNILKTSDTQELLELLATLTKHQTIETMNCYEINILMKCFTPSPKEYSKIFTGRYIYYSIQSAYTTAEKKTLKKWIDEQELLQIYPHLANTNSDEWESYFEKLCHIVCKKNLFSAHPEKGQTVGDILPAPLTSEGESSWYRVYQATHNGYGRVCYILLPLGNDSRHPIIKLFRSTASDNYASFGKKSLRSDFNLLNFPGYEGIEKVLNFEASEITNKTIPVWYAYQLLAKDFLQQGKIQEAFNLLSNSNIELYEYMLTKYEPLNFKQIVRKYDGIINTLYCLGKIESWLFESLHKMMKETTLSSLQDKVLAHELIDQLEKIDCIENLHNKTANGIMNEITMLYQEIFDNLTRKSTIRQIEMFDNFNKEIYQLVISLKNQTKLAMHDSQKAQILMQQWIKEIEAFAAKNHENLSSKQSRDLIYAGHSLGGGCSQATFYYDLIKTRRLPCPGSHCSVIAFDAPGINSEDNEEFKQFIFKHAALIKGLSINYHIYHQHEVGDPVPSSGTHLGSCNTPQEAAQLMIATDYRAVILKRNPDAKTRAIAESQTVHATQFLWGKEGFDYTKHVSNPLEMRLYENASSVQDIPAIKMQGEKAKNQWQPAFYLTPEMVDLIINNTIFYNLVRLLAGSTWIENEEYLLPFLDEYCNLVVYENGISYAEIPSK